MTEDIKETSMNKIRYAVIGIKGVGKYHIHFAKIFNELELVAIVDNDSDYLERKSKELGVLGFTNYQDLLNTDIIDAVSIATPHHLHHPMGMDFIKNGIHVLIEKPLAIRLSEAEEMVNMAKEKKIKICVAHQYRTHRSSVALKEIIDMGEIGKIMRILWTWTQYRSNAYYSKNHWRAKWKHSGGGLLMNQASHDIDLIQWLFGDPMEVTALAGNQIHDNELDDIACVNILFKNGAFGNFQFSINQPGIYNTRQVVGDKGMIVFNEVKSLVDDQDDPIQLGKFEDSVIRLSKKLEDHHYQPAVKWEKINLPRKNDDTFIKTLARRFDNVILRRITRYKWSLQETNWLKRGKPIGHYALFHSFIDAIKNDKQPIISGESSLKTIELINAIIMSAILHKSVTFPLDNDEFDEMFDNLCRGNTKIFKGPFV